MYKPLRTSTNKFPSSSLLLRMNSKLRYPKFLLRMLWFSLPWKNSTGG